MKRICLSVFSFILILFGLFASDTLSAAALEQTQNIYVYKNSDGKYVVEWTQVPDNCGYAVYLGDVRTVTDTNVNYLTVDGQTFLPGENTIAVAAIDGEGVEGGRTTETYVHYVSFEAPQNLSYDAESGILSWSDNNVSATYEVVVNRVRIASKLTEKQVDLSEYIVNVGVYEIRVKANGNGYYLSSEFSNSFGYTLRRALASPAALSVSAQDDGVVASWTAVDRAEKYLVEIKKDGQTIHSLECSDNSVDISGYVSDVAEYTVCVSATESNGGLYSASAATTCEYKVRGSLGAPVLKLDGTVVSWEKLDNARIYSVAVDGNPAGGEITATSFDVADYVKAPGAHKISVQAEENGLYTAGKISEIYCYTYGKLATPTLVVENGTVSWTAVENAKDYTVKIDGDVIGDHITETSVDLSKYIAAAGEYVVSVKANEVGFYLESAFADVTYVLKVSLGKPEATFDESTLTLSWNAVVGADEYVVTLNGTKVAETTSTEHRFAATDFASAGDYTVGVYAKGYNSFTDGDTATVIYKKQALSSDRKVSVEGGEISALISNGYVAYAVNGDSAVELGSDILNADGSFKTDVSAYEGQTLAFVTAYTEEDLALGKSIILYTAAALSEGTTTVVANEYYVDSNGIEFIALSDGLYFVTVDGNTYAVAASGGYVVSVNGASADDYLPLTVLE